MKFKAALIAFAAISLHGCQSPGKGTLAVVGPLPNAGIVETSDATVSSVLVTDALPEGAVEIGSVEGRDCKNSLLDPAPSKDDAISQVRQKAFEMGATGIHSVTFGTDENPTSMNCWATIRAAAVAYRL